MTKTGRVTKNAALNFINESTLLISGIFFSVLIARVLRPDNYGIYSFVFSMLAFGSALASLGLESTVVKYVSEFIGRGRGDEVISLLRLVLMVVLSVSAVLAALLAVFSPRLAVLLNFSGDSVLLAVVALMLVPQTLRGFVISALAGFQEFRSITWISLISTLLKFFLILLVWASGCSVFKLLLVEWAIGITVAVLAGYRLRRLVSIQRTSGVALEREIINRVAKYAACLLVITIFNLIVFNRSEVFFISAFWPSREVGFYNLAFTISNWITILLPGVLGGVLLPATSEQFGKTGKEGMRSLFVDSTRYLIIAMFPVGIGGIILAKSIILLAYGADYLPSTAVLQILLVSTTVGAILTGAATAILGMDRPDFIVKVGLLRVALNLSANLMLVPRYGSMGAAIAKTLTIVLPAPIPLYFVCRQLKVHFPFDSLIKSLLAAGLMGVGVLIIHSHFDSFLGLAITVPTGAFLYVLVLFGLKEITQSDLDVLKRLADTIPFLGQYLSKLLTLVERLV